MITLFRKIRQRLVASGSVTKYLLYAIGEILLVVVGILIALQVNNWNEVRKLQNQEKYLLKELAKEFRQNAGDLKLDYESNYKGMASAFLFIEMLQKQTPENVKQSEVDSLVRSLISDYREFDPTSGVIDDIINSGKLDVIQNDSLRYVLSQWSGQLVDIGQDYSFRNEYFIHHVLEELTSVRPGENSLFKRRQLLENDTLTTKLILPQSADMRLMFEDPNLRGVLAMHAQNQEYILSNLLRLQKYVDNAIKLIESEQARF